jgi:enoyl-CoA hydratase
MTSESHQTGDASDGTVDESRSDPDGLVRIDKPRPHTTVITMNRPERMNSMAFELMVPLHAAFASVAEDHDTTCVVLTGEGRGFCSGADTADSEPPPNIEGLTLEEKEKRNALAES